MLEYLKYKKYEREITKKAKEIIKILNSNTSSEFLEIVYTQEEIKSNIEQILAFFELEGEYWIAFFDKSYKPTLENLDFVKKKFGKKGEKVLNKMDRLIKMNIKLLQEDKMQIDLSNELHVDIVFDFLTNPKYNYHFKELEGIINGIARNIDINIRSVYLLEIVELIVKHNKFKAKMLENLFKKRISWKDLDLSYFKAIFLVVLKDKAKDYVNIYDTMNLLIVDRFLSSNSFDMSFKLALLDIYWEDKEILKHFQKRLKGTSWEDVVDRRMADLEFNEKINNTIKKEGL